MARSARSAATGREHGRFELAGASPGPGTAEEFDEWDIWGSFSPADHVKQQQQARSTAELLPRVPATARPGRKTSKPASSAAHGSLPVNIPDWSKILGDAYRSHSQQAGDWELDDVDDEDTDGAPVVPPHELACRRRAASLSAHGGIGIGWTLKVRDAVWKQTGFQA